MLIWDCWYFSWQSWFQLVIHPNWYFTWWTLHRSYISWVAIYSLVIPLSQCSNYCTIVLISHISKVMFKTFKLGFNSTWTKNFQMYTLGLEEPEEPEIKLPTFVGSWEKQGNYRKNIYFCFTDYNKAFDCVDHNKLWKILEDMEYQTSLPVSWETCKWVKKQQLNNWLVQNWERGMTRLYIATQLI